MDKLIKITDSIYTFYCPGCKYEHPYEVPRWTWNGSMEKPTFSPSLLCNQHDDQHRCHLFVVEGIIQYCNDCYHDLKGKYVIMYDWNDSLEVWQDENGNKVIC
jgi:hypothetical protein